ncbi:MFS transporter [Cutibacterium avidum]|uniref:MFS transporter n=1 Tax=Actinomycetes TaxID=1760 RepID=UPI002093C843|nr:MULTISPECIES: MFS transporter [Actinomycetes]MCO6680238.1 MFS transporter [Cutibacterium avidum]MDK7742186.1 MFS transporter [Helcobacillus massiliensis]WOO93739.1 MFS transporter [Helcobacillus massiliensis]
MPAHLEDTPSAPPDRWARNTVLFVTGQTVSLFGSMIVQFAVMWHITLETRSGMALGLFMLAAFGPQGVMSIFGGVLADRLDRKKLIIAADSLIAATTLILAILMSIGLTDLWLILTAVAIRSVGAGVQTPTVQALIPQIVPQEHLMRINGIFQTINSAMALLAPAAGAAIYASADIIAAFYLDVLTAVLGIGLLLFVGVPTVQANGDKRESYRRELVEGMHYISSNPLIRWLLLVLALFFLLSQAPAMVVSPLLIAESFGTEPWMLAVMQMLLSIGTMLGGILVATLFAKSSRIGLLLGSAYAVAAFTVALGLSPNLWLYYLFTFLFGLAVPAFSAPFMTLIQQTVDPGMLGRVFSYVSIAMTLSTPAGVIIFGPLADVVRLQGLLISSGTALIVVLTLATALPSGRAVIRAARSNSATNESKNPTGQTTQ